MMQDPKRLLVSLLTGNAMTNIAIAFFPALIANRYFENNNGWDDDYTIYLPKKNCLLVYIL